RPDAHAAFTCDVSKRAQVEKLKEYSRERWIRAPNVIVNCAGITRDSILLNMTEEQFDEVIGVNLKGVYLVTKALTELALADEVSQSIINISSIVGKSGHSGQANYAATKVFFLFIYPPTEQNLLRLREKHLGNKLLQSTALCIIIIIIIIIIINILQR
ncbi:unnamed protein product, partial [Gongylonema pulchrum]|uniref:Estradiol 17-beta-dehydrogenase 8 n=1 Tax=Gongylonema pulchrum TaxID=637853 RepID=A0A183ERC7_9BILA